jgi:hypothetical protein
VAALRTLSAATAELRAILRGCGCPDRFSGDARAFRKRYGFTPSRFRANCLRPAFNQTLQTEKASEGIDMTCRFGAQG